MLHDEAFHVTRDPWEEVTDQTDGRIVVPSAPERSSVEESTDEDQLDGGRDDGRERLLARTRRTIARERQLVRRSATKVLELQSADRGLLATAAAILSVNPENLVDLTVAIVTATGKDLQAVSDTKSILDADQLEAGVIATALGRGRLRQVWKLLGGLGVIAGELPSSDAKAAIALVRAIHAGGAENARARIDQAMNLLRK